MSESIEVIDENVTHSDSTDLIINKKIEGFLSEIGKWSKFLSIVGFIGIGFLIIVAIFFLQFVGDLPRGLNGQEKIVPLVYIIMAALYFFPVYYLYKFSDKIKIGIAKRDESSLTDGFEYFKSHYKFLGVMTIVILSIYVLIFIFGILSAL